MKSKKKVLPFEECCYPYRCTFTKSNASGNKVCVGVNGKHFYYPVGVETTVDQPAWKILKDIQPTRKFLPERDYDPFKDNLYKNV